MSDGTAGFEGDLGALPPCIGAVARRIDRLERAVLAPFPILDERRPKSVDQARDQLQQVEAWAQRIEWIRTGYWSGTRQMKRRARSLAGQFEVHSNGESIERAADLLGHPPLAMVRGSLAAGVYDRTRSALAHEDVMAAWPETRRTLIRTYHAACAQLLACVSWARMGITAIEDAMVPRIEVDSHHRRARVRSAGREYTVALTERQCVALKEFKESGHFDAEHRSLIRGRPAGPTSQSLTGRLPELNPHLVSVPPELSTGSTYGATYRISEAARTRLRILPG